MKQFVFTILIGLLLVSGACAGYRANTPTTNEPLTWADTQTFDGAAGTLQKDLGGDASTPATGYGTWYVKSDKPYFRADTGTVYDLTQVSGAVLLTGAQTVTGTKTFNAVQYFNNGIQSTTGNITIQPGSSRQIQISNQGGSLRIVIDSTRHILYEPIIAKRSGAPATQAVGCWFYELTTNNRVYAKTSLGTTYDLTNLGDVQLTNDQTISGLKTLTNASGLQFIELGSDPATPASGYGRYFARDDGKPYFISDAGTVYDLSESASGMTLDTAQTVSGTKTFSIVQYFNAQIQSSGSNDLVLQPASTQSLRVKNSAGTDRIVINDTQMYFYNAPIFATVTSHPTQIAAGARVYTLQSDNKLYCRINGGTVYDLTKQGDMELGTIQTNTGLKTFSGFSFAVSSANATDPGASGGKIFIYGKTDNKLYARVGTGTIYNLSDGPSNMVTLDTTQTITGQKTFSQNTLLRGIRGDGTNAMTIQGTSGQATTWYSSDGNANEIRVPATGGEVEFFRGIDAYANANDSTQAGIFNGENVSRVVTIKGGMPTSGGVTDNVMQIEVSGKTLTGNFNGDILTLYKSGNTIGANTWSKAIMRIWDNDSYVSTVTGPLLRLQWTNAHANNRAMLDFTIPSAQTDTGYFWKVGNDLGSTLTFQADMDGNIDTDGDITCAVLTSDNILFRSFDTFIGHDVAPSPVSDFFNLGIGYETLGNAALNGSSYVVAIGYRAGYNLTSSGTNGCVHIGRSSGLNHTSSYANVAIGFEPMGLGAGGNAGYNVAIGFRPLQDLTNGDNNVAVGANVFAEITTESSNTGIGYEAGRYATGNPNVYAGTQAGHQTDGTYNAAVGVGALTQATDLNADYCAALGPYALYPNSTSGLTFTNVVGIGRRAGSFVSTSQTNQLFIGGYTGSQQYPLHHNYEVPSADVASGNWTRDINRTTYYTPINTTANEFADAQTFDEMVIHAGHDTYSNDASPSTTVDHIYIDADSNDVTLTLPVVDGGKWSVIAKTDPTGNTITIQGATGNVNGASTYTNLDTQYEHIDIHCDGTDFYAASMQP